LPGSAVTLSRSAPPARRVQGGSVTKATCPAFSQTVTTRTTYTKLSKVQRLQQFAASLGEVQAAHTYKMAAALTFTGQQGLAEGGISTNTWRGQVADIADTAALTTERGVSTTISVPQSAEFAVGNGQQARCSFVFSTVALVIPYTATTVLLFDAEGDTSWAASFTALYHAASASNIDTVVSFTKAGGQSGRRRRAGWPPAY
jgi:hypothetical protein